MKLCELVAKIAVGIPAVSSGKVTIINNVNPFFEVETNACLLENIARHLIETACLHTVDMPVKIWAKQFHNVTVMHVKYQDNRIESWIEELLGQMAPLTEEMGGCVYMNINEAQEVSVAFTFLTSCFITLNPAVPPAHSVGATQNRLSA